MEEVELYSWEQDKPYRLTLDYEDDLEMFRTLISHVGIDINGKELVDFLDKNKKISSINLHRQQEYLDNQERFNVDVRKHLNKLEGN